MMAAAFTVPMIVLMFMITAWIKRRLHFDAGGCGCDQVVVLSGQVVSDISNIICWFLEFGDHFSPRGLQYAGSHTQACAICNPAPIRAEGNAQYTPDALTGPNHLSRRHIP